MLTELLLETILEIISSLGYFGIFFLMLLESTVMPVPSELVMPFAGFLTLNQTFDFWIVVIAATFGSIIGSGISYFFGKFFGREAIIRFGKIVFLDKQHLEIAHDWFEKFGAKTVFFCRFVPAIRHVISIPAGIAEMNFSKFLAYTAIGAFCWNAFLAFAGMQLGKNWLEISKYSSSLDIIIIVAAIAFTALFFVKHLKNVKKSGF